ncbi:hypothetical protein J2789_004482 [Variovorax paradoxus]|nr:hypothetical protein [Variovorax paradoxus]
MRLAPHSGGTPFPSAADRIGALVFDSLPPPTPHAGRYAVLGASRRRGLFFVLRFMACSLFFLPIFEMATDGNSKCHLLRMPI